MCEVKSPKSVMVLFVKKEDFWLWGRSCFYWSISAGVMYFTDSTTDTAEWNHIDSRTSALLFWYYMVTTYSANVVALETNILYFMHIRIYYIYMFVLYRLGILFCRGWDLVFDRGVDIKEGTVWAMSRYKRRGRVSGAFVIDLYFLGDWAPTLICFGRL